VGGRGKGGNDNEDARTGFGEAESCGGGGQIIQSCSVRGINLPLNMTAVCKGKERPKPRLQGGTGGESVTRAKSRQSVTKAHLSEIPVSREKQHSLKRKILNSLEEGKIEMGCEVVDAAAGRERKI